LLPVICYLLFAIATPRISTQRPFSSMSPTSYRQGLSPQDKRNNKAEG